MALVQGNEYIAELVQGSLFENQRQAATGIVFFVAEFGEGADPRPLDILIAVPAPCMKNWLMMSIEKSSKARSGPPH